jgi:hypothetical protein
MTGSLFMGKVWTCRCKCGMRIFCRQCEEGNNESDFFCLLSVIMEPKFLVAPWLSNFRKMGQNVGILKIR